MISGVAEFISNELNSLRPENASITSKEFTPRTDAMTKTACQKSHISCLENVNKQKNASRLAERIADTDLLVQKHRDLQSSIEEIKLLYDREKQLRTDFEQQVYELQKNCKEQKGKITELTMKCNQLQAQLDNKKPSVEFLGLVEAYMRLARKAVEDDVISKSDIKIYNELEEFCKENQIIIPKLVCSKHNVKVMKADVGIECLIWSGRAKASPKPDKCTRGTQCQAVKTHDQGTQYKIFTKYYEKSTCFPEPKDLPTVNEILNEVLEWNCKEPVSPIVDLSILHNLEEETSGESVNKISVRTIGTCTNLCNVRKDIDYKGTQPNIKCSKSQPPSVDGTVKNETPQIQDNGYRQFPQIRNCPRDIFEEMWQMFGHILFGLMQTQPDPSITRQEDINNWHPCAFEMHHSAPHATSIPLNETVSPTNQNSCLASQDKSNNQSDCIRRKSHNINTSPVHIQDIISIETAKKTKLTNIDLVSNDNADQIPLKRIRLIEKPKNTKLALGLKRKKIKIKKYSNSEGTAANTLIPLNDNSIEAVKVLSPNERTLLELSQNMKNSEFPCKIIIDKQNETDCIQYNNCESQKSTNSLPPCSTENCAQEMSNSSAVIKSTPEIFSFDKNSELNSISALTYTNDKILKSNNSNDNFKNNTNVTHEITPDEKCNNSRKRKNSLPRKSSARLEAKRSKENETERIKTIKVNETKQANCDKFETKMKSHDESAEMENNISLGEITTDEVEIISSVQSSDQYDSPASPPLPMFTDTTQITKIPLIRSKINLSGYSKKSLLDHLLSQESKRKKRVQVEKNQKDSVNQIMAKVTEYLQNKSDSIEPEDLHQKLRNISNDEQLYVSAFVDHIAQLKQIEPNVLERLKISVQYFQEIYPTFIRSYLRKVTIKLFKMKSNEKPGLEIAVSLTKAYIHIVYLEYSLSLRNQVEYCNPARIFIAECLYYYQTCAMRLIYEVLCCFPTVLPHREATDYDHSDALISVIKHELMHHKYDMYDAKLCGREILSKLRYEYHFEIYKPLTNDLLNELVEKLRIGSNLEQLPLAFAVFCKRMQRQKVVHDVLKVHLLPLANSFLEMDMEITVNDKRIAVLLKCISMIVKTLPLDTDVNDYITLFTRFLNGISRSTVQEAAVQGILRLQRFGYTLCWSVLNNFKPVYKLQPLTLAMLSNYAQRSAQYGRSGKCKR